MIYMVKQSACILIMPSIKQGVPSTEITGYRKSTCKVSTTRSVTIDSSDTHFVFTESASETVDNHEMIVTQSLNQFLVIKENVGVSRKKNRKNIRGHHLQYTYKPIYNIEYMIDWHF